MKTTTKRIATALHRAIYANHKNPTAEMQKQIIDLRDNAQCRRVDSETAAYPGTDVPNDPERRRADADFALLQTLADDLEELEMCSH